MADYVTGIKTNEGVKKIDYDYLANKLTTADGREDGYLISAEDKDKLDNTASNDELINLQNEINTMQTNIANTLDTKVDKNTFNSTVSNLSSNIDSKAQTNHSSTATTYGIGTDTTYGHVKLSDNFSGQTSEVKGVAASTKAVNDLAGTVNQLAQRVPTFGDYVVQQGESVVDNITWTYRKWNSGVSECWGRYSREFNKETNPLPISPSDDVTGVYYLSANLFAKYPTGLFLDIPKCIASYVGLTKGPLKKSQRATTYAGFLYTKEQPTASETGIYSIYRIGAIPSSDLNDEIIKWYVYIDFHVIGKWKELK